MTLLKRRIAGALAIIGVASLITFLQVEANHETDDQINEEAIWNAGPEDLSAIGRLVKRPMRRDTATASLIKWGNTRRPTLWLSRR